MTEATLSELLERYVTLRDTIESLEHEKKELGEQIKAALAAGNAVSSAEHESQLQHRKRLSYPMADFRAAFGDELALEAASIDRKKAAELAAAGRIDPERLSGIERVEGVISALVVKTKKG